MLYYILIQRFVYLPQQPHFWHGLFDGKAMIVCHPVNGVLPSMADPVAAPQVAVGRDQGQDVVEDFVGQVVDRFRSGLDICVETVRSDVEILFFCFHF